MTATVTARVEVLTAEVRILMVGSRQVTLSVFRQLDLVSCALIEPFGRMRDKPADDWVDVVGRSTRPTDEGSLVRASLSVTNEQRQAQRYRDLGTGAIWDGDTGREMTREERELAARACQSRAWIAAEWAKLPLIVLAGLR